MALKVKDILKTLYAELEDKKSYSAYKASSCDYCGDDIEESDDFYFMAGKRKICSECLSDIMEYLEVQISEI